MQDERFAADYRFSAPVRIVKGDRSDAIYALLNGQRWLLIDWVYANWGWALGGGLDRGFGPLEILAQDQVDAIPDSVYLWPPRDGQLIKGDANPTVYLIEQRLKHGIPDMTVFDSCGFSLADIIEASQADVNRFPEGQVFTRCR